MLLGAQVTEVEVGDIIKTALNAEGIVLEIFPNNGVVRVMVISKTLVWPRGRFQSWTLHKHTEIIAKANRKKVENGSQK